MNRLPSRRRPLAIAFHLPVLVLCGLLLPVAGAQPAASDGRTEAYYASLSFRESPYAGFRGVAPLTHDEAAARNHYRFVYRPDGRVAEIAFRLGDRLRPTNHTANHFFLAPLIRFRYGDGLEERTFFDHHGRPTAVRGEVYREVYTLDELGYRTRLHFEGRDGSRVENGWGIGSYHWRTEDDGRVVEWRKSLAGKAVPLRPGFDFGVIRLSYDVRGMVSLMQNIGRDGELVENDSGAAQDRLEYLPGGIHHAWNVLDAAGRPERGNGPDVARGIIERDRFGYETAIRYEDEDGEPIANAYGFIRSKTSYDRFGNWLSRAFYDAEGRPAPVEGLGYQRYEFEWGADGRNLLSLQYLDADGRPVAHGRRGYSRVEMEYDDRGNQLRLRYLDAAGRPVARSDRDFATIERRFDDGGFLLEERFLDAAGRPVADRRTGCARRIYRYAADGFRDEERCHDQGGTVKADG